MSLMFKMTSLTQEELRTVHDTILRAEQVRKEGVKDLTDLFNGNPRLIITPNDKCVEQCFHCVADSSPKGTTMSYNRFTNIDPRFFQTFSVADFGRRGNPLLYHSEGHDLADMISFLNDQGINEITLALAIQRKEVPIISKLGDLVTNERANIETMVTYHHYFENFDPKQLAKDFNSTLKHYIKFSKKFVISLVGDEYSQQEPTKAEEVRNAFQDNWETIFEGLNIRKSEEGSYFVNYESKEAEVLIPPVDTRVYPLGRFREYLIDQDLLEHYSTKFEESMGDYVCPDLVKWPGVIVEPNGDLNLCASFEAVCCRGAIVSNIFDQTYLELLDELQQFHAKEMNWFIDNLPGIIAGETSTCKLKNECYNV